VLKAIGDADLIVFLAPITDKLTEYEKFLAMSERKNTKHIVLLTKMDFVKQGPFSVNKKVGKAGLLSEIAKHLPNSPFLFDTEILTTDNIRDIYKELIRESIFENLSDEIPYESDVTIEKIDEDEGMDRVYATIVVEKDTQKGMIVGQKGEGIKRVGKLARQQMEVFSGKRIFLDLHVSVKKGIV